MGNMILVALLLGLLPSEVLSIQVVVPETERRAFLFGSVVMRCDFSTSANLQDVLVTWRFKSFCKDPVLEYYSTAYQAALQLGQDPSNDCPDRQRTVRVVIQKRGNNGAILGAEYRERKITILNKADLSITEIMWWDNGVYFCSIDADGDTTGDSDREIKLIVYHWLTVLLIIIGGLLLLMLFFICCCQCCPQHCCCYVRCPCCPQTCCCPEKAVMQHRMLKEAQKAMVPWAHGQPVYAPISSGGSSVGQPVLYSGSFSEYPVKQNFAMAPMGPPPQPLQLYPPPPPHHGNGSVHGSFQGTNQVLDYLESQVRGMDVGAAPMPPRAVHALPQTQPHLQSQPLQPIHQAVPFSQGPPSMLSALDERGVRAAERRVITLPPIIQRIPSISSRRGAVGGEPARGGPRMSSQSSGSSNRTGVAGRGRSRDNHGYRDPSPPRRGILRGYSDDSDWESRRGGGARGGVAREERQRSPDRRDRGSRQRSRSRDYLMDELRRAAPRRDRSYSPPGNRRGSWSSEEEYSKRGGGGGKGRQWPEKPPSYSSIEMRPGHSNGRGNYDRFSDKSSRSGASVVI